MLQELQAGEEEREEEASFQPKLACLVGLQPGYKEEMKYWLKWLPPLVRWKVWKCQLVILALLVTFDKVGQVT